MFKPFFKIHLELRVIFSAGLDDLIAQYMAKDDMGMWLCHQCDFSSRQRHHVKAHVESKHIDSGGFMCPVCAIVCPTRNALTMHNHRKHKVK